MLCTYSPVDIFTCWATFYPSWQQMHLSDAYAVKALWIICLHSAHGGWVHLPPWGVMVKVCSHRLPCLVGFVSCSMKFLCHANVWLTLLVTVIICVKYIYYFYHCYYYGHWLAVFQGEPRDEWSSGFMGQPMATFCHPTVSVEQWRKCTAL